MDINMDGKHKEKGLEVTARIKKELEVASDLFFLTTQMLSEITDAKHPYTEGHSERVRLFSLAVGREMNLSERDMATLSLAAKLHDIGKLKISDRILDKTGPLTVEERSEMERHPLYSVRMLGEHPALLPVLSAIRSHHEHISGNGYPDGLRDKQIPILSRIIAMVDIFDAMTTQRKYREGIYTDEEAIQYIKDMSGDIFDPEIAEIFISLYKKGIVDLCRGEYLLKDSPEEALEFYKKSLSKPLPDDEKSLVYLRLGSIRNKLWQPEKAIRYLKEALKYGKKYRHQILNESAFSHYYMGNIEALYKNYKRIQKEKDVPTLEKIRALFSLLLYYWKKYQPDKAISLIPQMETLFDKVDREKATWLEQDLLIGIERKRIIFKDFEQLRSMSYNILGKILQNQGRFKESISYYNYSIELKTRIGDLLGKAMSLYGCAQTHLWAKEIKMAESLARSCLRLNYENKDNLGIFLSCLLLSDVYREMGEYDRVISYLRKANELKDEFKEIDNYFKYYISRWLYLIVSGDSSKVIDKAQSIIEKGGFSDLIKGDLLFCYGRALEEEKRNKEAEEFYKNSLKIFNQLKQKPQTEKVENRLKNLHQTS